MKKKLLLTVVALFTVYLCTWAQSGTCGENLTWKIENGVLTISGTGEMSSYYLENADDRHGPWNDYLEAFTSIVVEEGVTAIGEYGFAKCSNVTSASLPSTLTNIEWSAFRDCKNLTTLEIPSSVTHIGAYAFDGCEKMVEKENNIRYVGSWAVGTTDDSFATYILHENTIGLIDRLFSECTELNSIDLPDNLKYIGCESFRRCSKMESLTIPASVIRIPLGLSEAHGLKHIVVDENNQVYDSRENCNAIIETGTNTLIVGCQSTVIPNSVTKIGIGAFRNWETLEKITIPLSIVEITQHAFEGCSNLINVISLSSTPPYLQGEAFTNIHPDAVLYVPDVKAYQESEWAQYFGGGIKALEEEAAEPFVDGIYYAFNEDGASVSVTYGPDGEGTYSGNVTVPASVSIGGKTYSVTGIGENAFKGCSSLTSVTLPEGLKTIGIRGFDVCTSLESINFPSTLTSIGDYAFALCAALKGEIVLPTGVTSLPIGAFAYCESITSLTLPSTFKTIGIETFLHCKSLETVNLPNGLTGIGESAFSGCVKLSSVEFPQNLVELGGNCFSGCTSLKSVSIPHGVKNIWTDTFAGCSSLETVTFSEGLELIGNNAFLCCSALKSASIPSTVKELGYNAFSQCTALMTITLSESLEKIGFNAFLQCHALKEIIIPENVTEMEDGIFNSCSSLESVTLPDGLAKMGKYVFVACNNLKDINIPSALKELPEGTFHDCCALEDVVIPASSTAIGINTFHNCQSLKNVTIPAGVTKIGASAFEWSGLTSVDIPETVTQIDEKAFSGCSALADVTVSWKEPISINENVFAESMRETLHVPSGAQSAYQQATGWKDFENIVSDDTEPEPEPETDNAFAINDTKVMAGSVFTVPVELKNSCEVAAFQCDIYLPEGITLQKNSKGKYEISLDENRKDDHTITIAEQPDGAIRIVVASLSSSTFSGTEGTLFNMELLAAEDASGEKNIAIKNVYISEANGKRHDLADAEATVSIQIYTPADANNDGMIAIDDVVLTINAVLGNTSENFVFDAADMNGDGQILIDDVVKVINAVLGVNTSAASNVRRADINESFILNHTESGLGMSVSNAAGYAALQYDLQLPEGAEVTDVRFTGKSNHKVTFREMDGNVVRVIVVSLTNEAFSGNELLDVMIDSAQDAEISIENACVATRNGAVSKVQNASAKIGGNATAIDQLLDGMARADVYDLNGKLVKKNAATAAGLQKGIYIINGKKITIK